MPHPDDRIALIHTVNRGRFPLVKPNNAMELQQSPVLNYGPDVSAAAAADRIVETSIPSRLARCPGAVFTPAS